MEVIKQDITKDNINSDSLIEDVVTQSVKVTKRIKEHSKIYVAGTMGQEDPEVYYTRENSAKRILFSGEDIVEVPLPVGTRVIYPRKPFYGLGDVPGAIRYAMLNPEKMEPLPQLLRAGMKVTIAIDDISLPLPVMQRPDLRQTMLEVCLEFIDEAGVDDVHIIIATAFHRRMMPC